MSLLSRRMLFATNDFTGGGDGDFSPLDISNCDLWLDADQIVGLSDNDQVATWPDASTAGNSPTNGSTFTRPRWKENIKNGLPVVRFSSGDVSFLGFPSLVEMVPGTLFVVVQVNASGTRAYLAHNGRVFRRSSSVARVQAHDDFGESQIGSPFVSDPGQGVWHAAELWVSSTEAQVTRTGGGSTTSGSVVSHSTGTWTFDKIGKRASSSDPLAGDVGEVIHYSRALNSTERGDVLDYLADRWAL